METTYDPKKTEQKWYKFWQKEHLFDAEKTSGKKPFSIVIPPPNITGILHMGHALNNTIQDVLIRYKRMQGYISLWMPGTDHAGIATQNVVERSLARKGVKKEDIGRDKFLAKLWDWTNAYGSTIISQLKRLGASCDWRRERFTMDEGYSSAVKEVFVQLYDKGLIYRGNYIINWCPRCKTALANEEAPYREIDGWLYYIRYPIKPPKFAKPKNESYIIVATTRPETMLGDTAVAINPKDKRYKFLKNYQVILPVMERELRVVEDTIVESSFGTGVVKVTPAHDKNDFLMAKKHNLDFINIMNEDASLNNQAGEFQGMDRFEAREALLEVLQEKGLIEKKEPYKISAGHCYRCHTIVEPRLSWQWFVKMKPLAKPAIKAVEKGKITFYPVRWRKVYLNWMYNIEDWCISRQIWWGHRLPVYYCKSCLKDKADTLQAANKGIVVSRERPKKCRECGSNEFVQEEDVLDTWFSSWLWPFATLGWPFMSPKGAQNKKADLEYFYPTDVLVTASEILFFWVARMIMAGIEFIEKIPFRGVLIHGTVRDIKGVKMSKSLGNIIDPIEIIDKFGADALRFSLMLLASSGQDVYLSEEKFLVGRNFANKIWNAARYIIIRCNQTNIKVTNIDKKDLKLVDKWILHELNAVIHQVTNDLERFRINEAAKSLYEFFWHKFCDWYIEISKIEKNKSKDSLLIIILDSILKLLHPLMPFVTEEIWQRIKADKEALSIMTSSWPKKLEIRIEKNKVNNFVMLKDLIVAIRAFKKDLAILQKIEIVVIAKNKEGRQLLAENLDWARFLARADITIAAKVPGDYVSTATIDYEFFVSVKIIKDINEHKKRIQKRMMQLNSIIEAQKNKLSNKSFLKKAPQDVVEKTRQSLEVSLEEQRRLKKIRW